MPWPGLQTEPRQPRPLSAVHAKLSPEERPLLKSKAGSKEPPTVDVKPDPELEVLLSSRFSSCRGGARAPSDPFERLKIARKLADKDSNPRRPAPPPSARADLPDDPLTRWKLGVAQQSSSRAAAQHSGSAAPGARERLDIAPRHRPRAPEADRQDAKPASSGVRSPQPRSLVPKQALASPSRPKITLRPLVNPIAPPPVDEPGSPPSQTPQAATRPASRKIEVTKLPHGLAEAGVRAIFAGYGPLERVQLVSHGNRPAAYVTFEREADAVSLVEGADTFPRVNYRRLHFKYKELWKLEAPAGVKVFVGPVPYRRAYQTLLGTHLSETFGMVANVKFVGYGRDGAFGAIVKFDKADAAARAVAHGTVQIQGKGLPKLDAAITYRQLTVYAGGPNDARARTREGPCAVTPALELEGERPV